MYSERIIFSFNTIYSQSLSKRGDQASPAQLGKTVYIIGSGLINDLLGGNKTLPPP